MERQAEGPLSFYQRFLRITFYTFRCSCARAPTRIRICGQIHIYSAFSFLSVLPLVSIDLLSYPPSSSTPFSFCLSSSFRATFVLFVAIVRTCTHAYMCVRVYVRLVSIVVREVSCRTALRSRGERAALYVGERENVF